jgi:hypothetical protein
MTRSAAIFGLSLLSLGAASTHLGAGMPFRSIQISKSRLHAFCSSLSLISLLLPSATLVIQSLITARSSLLHPKKITVVCCHFCLFLFFFCFLLILHSLLLISRFFRAIRNHEALRLLLSWGRPAPGTRLRFEPRRRLEPSRWLVL